MMKSFRSNTTCNLEASEQRKQFNMSIEDFYYAGMFLLEDAAIQVDLSTDNGIFKEHSWEKMQEVVAHNQKLEDLTDEWKKVYNLIQDKSKSFEDCVLLVDIMDEIYTKIHQNSMELVEMQSGLPRLCLLSEVYRLKKTASFLNDEHLLQNIHPENLQRFKKVEEEIEIAFDALYYTVHFGSEEGENFEFGFKLLKNNISELLNYARTLVYSDAALEY